MTAQDAEAYIPDVTEEVFNVVNLVVLTSSQFCVVLNVVNEKGVNQLGKKELRKGVRKSPWPMPPVSLMTPRALKYSCPLSSFVLSFLHSGSFFLHPGEKLEQGVQKAYLLGENEAVLLKSQVSFVDLNDPAHPRGKDRIPGEVWMVFGGFLALLDSASSTS